MPEIVIAACQKLLEHQLSQSTVPIPGLKLQQDANETSATISVEIKRNVRLDNNPHNASPEARAFLLVRFIAAG
ncbi:MAG: hypothetical protein GY767_18415 [Shimia sp.]|nr:hypothetical protein [Shimia sp.]